MILEIIVGLGALSGLFFLFFLIGFFMKVFFRGLLHKIGLDDFWNVFLGFFFIVIVFLIGVFSYGIGRTILEVLK